jgi:hypothetical protein
MDFDLLKNAVCKEMRELLLLLDAMEIQGKPYIVKEKVRRRISKLCAMLESIIDNEARR